MRKIILVQAAIADYRQGFLDEVSKSLGHGFSVLVGRNYFYSSVKTNVTLDNLNYVSNVFLLRRSFLFQYGVVFRSIKSDLVILEFNPRILSNWIIALVRRSIGRPVIFWGHAWSRGGFYSKSEIVRGLMRRLSSCFISYTDSQRLEIVDRCKPTYSVFAAPNSLYRSVDMVPVLGGRGNILYVGRLVLDKKVDVLIKAFSLSALRNVGVRLVIVGDGPELSSLKDLCSNLGLSSVVDFLGHIASVEALHDIYSDVLCSVSPGYAGLSVTQSLGFGVPILISRNEPHAPEVEAVVEGENGLYFETDNPSSLSNLLISVHDDRNTWLARTEVISSTCRGRYSVEAMANNFCKAINSLG